MARTGGGPARISEKNDRPRDIKYVLLGLWHYISHYKFYLIAAILLTIGSNVLHLSDLCYLDLP